MNPSTWCAGSGDVNRSVGELGAEAPSMVGSATIRWEAARRTSCCSVARSCWFVIFAVRGAVAAWANDVAETGRAVDTRKTRATREARDTTSNAIEARCPTGVGRGGERSRSSVLSLGGRELNDERQYRIAPRIPPPAETISPVIAAALGEHKNATTSATSADSTIRPMTLVVERAA